MLLKNERQLIVEYGRKLVRTGLVTGTSGNLSVCDPEKTRAAISPTGVSYDEMTPQDVVVVDLEGEIVDGELKPTSEIAFHLALLNLRPDILAVVHTHSSFATTVACLGWELPAIHYHVGFAGVSIPCAPYATYGTQELSDSICSTIGERNAVLLANHGVVTVGRTLERAFVAAEQVEYVSRLYLQAKAVGEPVILGEDEMTKVIHKLQAYGQNNK
jgi:L-fuculose-phosphate aldolase